MHLCHTKVGESKCNIQEVKMGKKNNNKTVKWEKSCKLNTVLNFVFRILFAT